MTASMRAQRSGFTLIELIVVMAIVALLVSIEAMGALGARHLLWFVQPQFQPSGSDPMVRCRADRAQRWSDRCARRQHPGVELGKRNRPGDQSDDPGCRRLCGADSRPGHRAIRWQLRRRDQCGAGSRAIGRRAGACWHGLVGFRKPSRQALKPNQCSGCTAAAPTADAQSCACALRQPASTSKASALRTKAS